MKIYFVSKFNQAIGLELILDFKLMSLYSFTFLSYISYKSET